MSLGGAHVSRFYSYLGHSCTRNASGATVFNPGPTAPSPLLNPLAAHQEIRGVISGYKLREVNSHISEGMIDIVAVEEEWG